MPTIANGSDLSIEVEEAPMFPNLDHGPVQGYSFLLGVSQLFHPFSEVFQPIIILTLPLVRVLLVSR